jgi:hypothetical protein
MGCYGTLNSNCLLRPLVITFDIFYIDFKLFLIQVVSINQLLLKLEIMKAKNTFRKLLQIQT